MNPETEQITRAVFSVTAKKGTHALLLGSGISRAAHIPTGWDIVLDLTRKLSLFLEDKEPDDASSWYKNRFGKDPDYSDILSVLGKTPAERNSLICGYFEPNAEENRRGWKRPTATHKSVAALMASGIIKIVLTTNFDRLLEKALSDINVSPIIIKQANDLEGISSLVHIEKPLLVKVNGDYLDSRIKNTPAELESYEPPMEKILSKVFAEFGLIVAGWSGKYDTGLIECYKRNTNKFFSTYWIDPYPLSMHALDLLNLRDGTFIKIDSDTFFSRLARKISPSDLEKSIPSNLPIAMSSFIGREKEILQIRDLFLDNRLITLLGPGGTGKTRLSIETAKAILCNYPDGVFFADLTSVIDGDHLASVICSAIGMSEDEIALPEKSLLGWLKDKKTLLILDNCEQIIGAVSTLVGKLVTLCEKISILATSREALFVEGEHQFKVLPLSVPDPRNKLPISELVKFESAQLFCDRSKNANPQFRLEDSNKDYIIGICHSLDGMPLAIELAAARTRVLTPKQILEKLSDRFKILTSSMRNVPTRQQTLQATIDWSFCLLDDKEKAIFLRLSMFCGGFTLEMAENICPDDTQSILEFSAERIPVIESWEVMDLVQSLCDKSLLRAIPTHETQRFSMFETIKEYAKMKFEEDSDSILFKKIYVTYFFNAISFHASKSDNRKDLQDFSGKEFDNIEESVTLSMKVGLYQYGFKILLQFCVHLRKKELHLLAIKLLEYALKYEDKCEKSDLSLVYYNLGWMQFSRNNFDVAKTSFLKSLDLAKLANSKKMSLRSYHGLVFFHTGIGDYHKAQEYNALYHETAKDIDDKIAILTSMTNSIEISLSIGEFGTIESKLREIESFSANGIGVDFGLLRYLQGNYFFAKGDYKKSRDLFLQALDNSKENFDLYLEFDCLFGIAMSDVWQYNYEKALNVIPRIEQISATLDDKNLLCGKWIITGNICLNKCMFTKAIECFAALLTDLSEYTNANHKHQAMLGLGQAQNRAGRCEESREILENLLSVTQNFRLRYLANLELAWQEIGKNTENAMQIIQECNKETSKLGNPKDKTEIARAMSVCLLKRGNALQAIKTLEEALEINDIDEPGELQCKSLLAFALVMNGEYEKSQVVAKGLSDKLEKLSMLWELQIIFYSQFLSNINDSSSENCKLTAQNINQKMGIEISSFERIFWNRLYQ